MGLGKFGGWLKKKAGRIAANVLTGGISESAAVVKSGAGKVKEKIMAPIREQEDLAEQANKDLLAQTKMLAEDNRKALDDLQATADSEAAAARGELASAEEAQARKSARERQRALAQGASGRRDTLLTGPLGIPGSGVSKSKKTLLGA